MKPDAPVHRRAHTLSWRWPDPPLRIVLVEPEIPPNTGNIARLCAATGTPLHLIEPLGFQLTDRAVRRAGLDYWNAVTLFRHRNFEEFLADVHPPRCFFFSVAAARACHAVAFAPGDALVFGSESRGLDDELLARHAGHVVGLPMRPGAVRSLNLAHAAGIALYEALRQFQHTAS